jgi:hypothetical protein
VQILIACDDDFTQAAAGDHGRVAGTSDAFSKRR